MNQFSILVVCQVDGMVYLGGGGTTIIRSSIALVQISLLYLFVLVQFQREEQRSTGSHCYCLHHSCLHTRNTNILAAITFKEVIGIGRAHVILIIIVNKYTNKQNDI